MNPVSPQFRPDALQPSPQRAGDGHPVDALIGRIMESSNPKKLDTEAIAQQLAALGAWIVETATRDRAAAAQSGIEALVNFAAGDGPAGSLAQRALCNVYANSPDPETRVLVLNSAHAMCIHALDNQSFHKSRSDGDGLPLSVTLAYMGGRAPDRPDGQNGNGIKPIFCGYLAKQLGIVAPKEQAELLDSNRYTDDNEVVAAATQALPAFEVTNWGASIHGHLDDIAEIARTADKPVMTWVNEKNHWMATIACKDGKGGVHWHVLNTLTTTQGGKEASRKLRDFLEASGHTVTIHQGKVDMQDTAAPNACGPVSYWVMTQVNQALSGPRSLPVGEIGSEIDRLIDEWLAKPHADRAAIDLAARAELMQAAADAHRNGNSPAPAQVAPPLPKDLPPQLTRSLADLGTSATPVTPIGSSKVEARQGDPTFIRYEAGQQYLKKQQADLRAKQDARAPATPAREPRAKSPTPAADHRRPPAPLGAHARAVQPMPTSAMPALPSRMPGGSAPAKSSASTAATTNREALTGARKRRADYFERVKNRDPETARKAAEEALEFVRNERRK